MKIADIKKEQPGSSIPSVSGKVADVYKRREVQTQRGPTTVQGMRLADGNDFIMIDLWGHDELSPYKGQDVVIANDRGLKLAENNYQNKQGKQITGVKLSAGEHATIKSPGWGTPEEPPAQQVKAPQIANSRPMQQAQLRATPDEQGVKAKLNRMANLYLDCILAADYVVANRELTPDHYQALVASLFITATREGLHDKMATGKFNMPHPEPEPEPTPQPQQPQRDPQPAFDPHDPNADFSDPPF